MAALCGGDGCLGFTGEISDAQGKKLTDLPAELLEFILCSPVLSYLDIASVSCSCKRLHDVCHGRGKVWEHQFKLRWPRLLKYYRQLECCDWLKEFQTRQSVGLQIRKTIESFSKRFFVEVPCVGQVLGDSFKELESLGAPEHFCEDELISILNSDKRKSLTLKYYAKKILYFLRQQNVLKSLKGFLRRSPDQHSPLEGAVLIDQYCNPLAEISLESISAQLEEITAKIKKTLQMRNPTHPSLRVADEDLEDLVLQRQVVCALNSVLYEQLQYKGNESDYYNPLNSYLHQVLTRRTGIPISLSVLYLTLAKKLGVKLEPVNFPNHFLLRWCQRSERSSDIYDYVYIDAFGKGKQLTAKECEYLIGHQVTSDYYSAVSTEEMLLRMVGNLLNIGKRGEGSEKSYQLLRDSLDLYLTINPDNVQYLLLQARLYFHLGIWPEKVLDILQHIQALDPSQHGAVGYLVQHTLEHIQHKSHPAEPKVKRRSDQENREVQYSTGLIMRHKRCVRVRVHVCVRVRVCVRSSRNLVFKVLRIPPLFVTSTCSIERDNLELHPSPLEISHPEVGRYFSEFRDSHYTANEQLQICYPEDLAHTTRVTQELYSTLSTGSEQEGPAEPQMHPAVKSQSH
ncbi:UNVERIFIED_CONTAM: hypothetical protein FKN15_025984 [Acipenser sinensis]